MTPMETVRLRYLIRCRRDLARILHEHDGMLGTQVTDQDRHRWGKRRLCLLSLASKLGAAQRALLDGKQPPPEVSELLANVRNFRADPLPDWSGLTI